MTLRLIVGLGNYDPSYGRTPHNIGFLAVDALARKWNAPWHSHKEAMAATGPSEVTLLKPKTFMNTSGPSVNWARKKWNVELTDMLVVLDDFVLPWGKLRFRLQGSAGGHNGLVSVIESLGSQSFPRLRIGIGPVPPGMDPKDFVLKPLRSGCLEELAEKAALAVETARDEGWQGAMNKHHTEGEIK